MLYFGLLIILFCLQLFYFKIAEKYNIIDIPNERSSHTFITLRGGGIIFPISVIIAFITKDISWPIMLAISIVSIISFIDDINPVNLLPRFITHFSAVFLVLFDLEMLNVSTGIIILIVILMIGWINAFNFMDGINGITVLYTTVAIASFGFLSVNENSNHLFLVLGAACGVFGFFNIRKKAKTFAGDVGSISLAVLLGYLMIKTIKNTNQIGFILFFAIYGIDSVITIFNRIKNKENIFKGHRTHLYQYLANEMNISHVYVSLIYAFLQLIINITVIYLFKINKLTYLNIIIYISLLSLVYTLIRYKLIKKINTKNSLLTNKT